MSKNAAKTLELLFAIEPEIITRDLRRAADDLQSIAEEIRAVQAVPFEARTPQMAAQQAHLLMVQAHELCRRDTMAPEVQTFYAAFGAGHIAQDAETVASDRDTCAELAARIDAIRRREGLADDEFWPVSEGPDDYRELNDHFERVLKRVADTIFVFALRRYHLSNHADLFEDDPTTFEIQREIGRRVIISTDPHSAEAEKMMDDYFRGEYGEAALQRVLERVQQICDNGT